MSVYLPIFFNTHRKFLIPTNKISSHGLTIIERCKTMIISALLIAYCSRKVYGIVKDIHNSNKCISTLTPDRVIPTPKKTPIHTFTDPKTLSARIKENQRRALETMGPDIINDPYARRCHEEMQKMIRPGVENDPILQELRKEVQEMWRQKNDMSMEDGTH